MRNINSIVISAPLDNVAKAICSEAYNVEENNSREDTVSTVFKPIGETDSRIEFEVETVEYERTKTGRIDRSKTKKSRTNNVWSKDKNTLTWVWHGTDSHRVKVSGVVEIHPQGESTRIVYNTDIEVSIPLIGNKIAGLIAKEFDKSMSRIKPILQRHSSK